MSLGGPKRLVRRIAWLVVAALALVAPAEAQLSLESSTVDGGGRVSSGGSFEVTGTIGQPDAGATSGGSLDIESGFWTSESPAVPVELMSFEVARSPRRKDARRAIDQAQWRLSLFLSVLAPWRQDSGPSLFHLWQAEILGQPISARYGQT